MKTENSLFRSHTFSWDYTNSPIILKTAVWAHNCGWLVTQDSGFKISRFMHKRIKNCKFKYLWSYFHPFVCRSLHCYTRSKLCKHRQYSIHQKSCPYKINLSVCLLAVSTSREFIPELHYTIQLQYFLPTIRSPNGQFTSSLSHDLLVKGELQLLQCCLNVSWISIMTS